MLERAPVHDIARVTGITLTFLEGSPGSIPKGLMVDDAAFKRLLRKLNRIEQLGTQVYKGLAERPGLCG